MNTNTDNPSLEELALRYKTISKKQLDYARILLHKKKKHLPDITIEKIIVEEKFATQEQMNILKLILEFLKLQEQSKKFGMLAVEMGFTTQDRVNVALKKQHLEFKASKNKKMLGDILVESGAITPSQRDAVTKEQQKMTRLNQRKINKREKLSGSGNNKKHDILQSEDTQETADIKQTRRIKQKKEIKQKQDTETRKNVAAQESNDSPIKVIISENSMEAWIQLSDIPSSNIPSSDISSEEINFKTIKTALHEKNVKFGIYNDTILQNSIDNKTDTFIAAEGRFPPVNKNMMVKYLFKTSDAQGLSDSQNNNTKVKKGEAIAVLEDEDTDLYGRNIFGEQVDERIYMGHPPSAFRCGNGTRISKDNMKSLAKKSGFPFLAIEKKLYILPVTNVLGDADLKFGVIEEFSDINVSGILTHAFPVKAGKINAREIRGTSIQALKDIVVKIGITNARIRTQGNVYARYIHNSTIEAFGNVIVKHEIIDSDIIISGKCEAIKSRIIASRISAKQGIIAAGAGSDVTEPCILCAGREDHIIGEINRINRNIELTEKKLIHLNKKKYELSAKGKQIFKKMAELKHFYDRVKEKQQTIVKTDKDDIPVSDKTNNIKTMKLKSELDKKIKSIITSVKALNTEKQSVEAKKHKIEKTINQIEPGIIRKINDYKRDRAFFVQWAEKAQGRSEIEIRGKIAEGTVFKGIFASMVTKKKYNNIRLVETCKKESECSEYEIAIDTSKPFPDSLSK